MSDLQARTIADFGEQWTEYPDSDGFFGSVDLFDDLFQPLLSAADVGGKEVAEIGAGIGRFVNVLAIPGAARVVALEPSDAFRVLQDNDRARIATASPISPPDGRLTAAVRRSGLRVHHRCAGPHSSTRPGRGGLVQGAQAWRQGGRAGSMAARVIRCTFCRADAVAADTTPSASAARVGGGGALPVLLVLHDRVPLPAATARRSTCAASCCRSRRRNAGW